MDSEEEGEREIALYRYKNIPLSLRLHDGKWYEGYCGMRHNGLRVTEAKIILGTKDIPSQDHLLVIFLHELGHLEDKLLFKPEDFAKEEEMKFLFKLFGFSEEYIEYRFKQEISAWKRALVWCVQFGISLQAFLEALCICISPLSKSLLLKFLDMFRKELDSIQQEGGLKNGTEEKREDDIHQ